MNHSLPESHQTVTSCRNHEMRTELTKKCARAHFECAASRRVPSRRVGLAIGMNQLANFEMARSDYEL